MEIEELISNLQSPITTMKICLLTDKYPPDPGGLANSTRRLAKGLAAAGHTVHVCLPAPALPPGQITQTDEAGLTVHRLGASRRTDDTWADCFDLITRLHRRVGFDLLHGYYLAGPGLATVYAARYLGLPSLVSARGNDLDRAAFHPDHTAILVWVLQHASAVTVVSQDLARKARALAPNCQPHVIPNGVDANLFSPPHPHLEQNQHTPCLGFVGEARLKKGLTILLPAFAQVAQRARQQGRPAPTLSLIGGVRPDETDIVKVFQAKQPDLALNVIPYTEQEQLPLLYHRLDVLVLPSLRDGLPNALLEGMACGCAVVASEVGGIPDVIRSAENGVLVPPGEVNVLAEAISELLQSPERRAALGQAARQTVLEQFTPERELAANLSLYTNLVNHRGTETQSF
ncbi:MAG: glycosyltransferase family 4 protein [Anaerolineae bacterium]